MTHLLENVYNIKASVGGALKMLIKSLKTVLDEVSFIVTLYSFPLSSGPPGKPSPKVSHLPFS